MDKVKTKYNVVGNSLFFHRTVTEACGGSYAVEPEVHRQFEIYYLISGKTSYVIEGRTYEPRPGDLILVAPNEIHTLKIDGCEPYERAVVLFDMEIMSDLFTKLGVQTHALMHGFHIIDGETVKKYRLDDTLLSIIEAEGDSQLRKLLAVSRLIEFIARLDAMSRDGELSYLSPTAVDSLISRAISYVNEHIGDRITLDGLAGALFVSKSTLCHRFKDCMSISASRYVNIRKMHYATELMRRGVSAQEAAVKVGFESYGSFFYNYKRIIGRSPSDTKGQKLVK